MSNAVSKACIEWQLCTPCHAAASHRYEGVWCTTGIWRVAGAEGGQLRVHRQRPPRQADASAEHCGGSAAVYRVLWLLMLCMPALGCAASPFAACQTWHHTAFKTTYVLNQVPRPVSVGLHVHIQTKGASKHVAGMSEPGGLGFGALGFQEKQARELAAAAGFTRFEVITDKFESQLNNVFQLLP